MCFDRRPYCMVSVLRTLAAGTAADGSMESSTLPSAEQGRGGRAASPRSGDGRRCGGVAAHLRPEVDGEADGVHGVGMPPDEETPEEDAAQAVPVQSRPLALDS